VHGKVQDADHRSGADSNVMIEEDDDDGNEEEEGEEGEEEGTD
jgi:hypothetical protein